MLNELLNEQINTNSLKKRTMTLAIGNFKYHPVSFLKQLFTLFFLSLAS
ncbi:hypothetical protein THOD04_110035 [Vibrio owensii]|nr:hypothetical protein THOD04_110035 [Vibrio owensii]